MPNRNYPIRMNLDEISKNTAKKDKASRDAKALQKGAVARGNREQAREANELEMMRKKRKGMKCGGKVHKMAGGGKVNHKGCGIAKRGLTKGKMR